MFKASGYFKSHLCPFYANGLCERPHCHYKHSTYSEKAIPKTSTLIASLSAAVRKTQREIDEYKKRYKQSKLKPALNFQAVNRAPVAFYKPTPRHLLKSQSDSSNKTPSTSDYVPTPKYEPQALKRKKEDNSDIETKEKRPRTENNSCINNHSHNKIDFDDTLTETDYAIVKQISKVNCKGCPEKTTESETAVNVHSEAKGNPSKADQIENSAGINKCPMESLKKESKEEDKSSISEKIIKTEAIEKEKKDLTGDREIDREIEKTTSTKDSKDNGEGNKDSKKKSNSSYKKKSRRHHHSDRDKKNEGKKSDKEIDKSHEHEKSRDKKRSEDKKHSSNKSESKSKNKKDEKKTSKSKNDSKNQKPKRIISHEELFGDSSSDNETIVCLRDSGKKATPNITDPSVSTSAKKNDSLSTESTQFSDSQSKHRIAHAGAEKVNRQLPKPVHVPSPVEVMQNRLLHYRQMRNEKDKVNAATNKKMATPCGTINKDGKTKRVAHNPGVIKKPIIIPDSKGIVPTNVRQRYLNLIIEEFLKMGLQDKDAYPQAENEEKQLCARAPSKKGYLNLAINLINRLRKANEKPDIKQSNNKESVLTHSMILGGYKALTTNYTVRRSGAQYDFSGKLKASDLYKHLEKHILTAQQLKENGFPLVNPNDQTKVVIDTSLRPPKSLNKLLKPQDKICSRCGEVFSILESGQYESERECVYHYGRSYRRRVAGSVDNRYTCCSGDLSAKGCCFAKNHVHDSNKYLDFEGFVQTQPHSFKTKEECGVYAVDCEMVYTVKGMELARVTLVDSDFDTVIEMKVLPSTPIIDYNTRFSGLSEENMKGVTYSLQEAQDILRDIISSRSILIGHSLESDLIALKISHRCVVDTSVIFPHKLGPPHKRALKNLMSQYLQKIIQNNVDGHDSKEDAVAAMELAIWKVKEDLKAKRVVS
ncbi:DgyrCDS922 [Dimorphilus gyrociliatus]|uniref:DgyrCDS922 n=1 Tax=Dimorphilus gyrociliatus TaxID=2664684 RepID=A0A7I8V8L6_9ANNE|nr:DgyrCDS922 [Dimorphilus gyrociliatus]